jgi:hypothetical protein
MMFKISLLIVCFLLVAGVAESGIIDSCQSTAVFNGALPECYFACPDGDTESFAQAGFSLSFRIVDSWGNPIAFIPATDFWLIDCDPARNLVLCAGSASSNADSSTNVHGRTTMSVTTLAVGGCANGLSPVVQGYVLGCPAYCFDVRVRSVDQNGDLQVNLQDGMLFAVRYPPMAYNECADFNCDGRVSLADLARLARHYGHVCP